MTLQAPDDLTTLSEGELGELLDQALLEERRASDRRQKAHDRLDFLRAGGGGSDPDATDRLEMAIVEERRLSDERNALHLLIDRLRAEYRRRRAAADDLEARVQRLEDERAILDTLHAYGHAIDYGLRDLWISCWTETAVLRWPHATFTGHEEIGAAFDDHSHAPEAYHKHFVVEPRIALGGDTATADSYFTRIDTGPNGPYLRSFGRYRDVLVRAEHGRWRIQERLCDRESLIPGAPTT